MSRGLIVVTAAAIALLSWSTPRLASAQKQSDKSPEQVLKPVLEPKQSRTNAKMRARALVREAEQLFNTGDHDNGIAKLERAFALYPAPALLYNLGVAYQVAKRSAEAFNAFARFLLLADFPSGAMLKAANQALRDLRPSLGHLRINVPYRKGAKVFIDKKLVGLAPLRLPVAVLPGKHEVTARLRGREVAWEPVEVVAGKFVNVKLWRRRGQNVVRLPRATSVEKPPILTTGSSNTVVRVRHRKRSKSRIYKRWWFWTVVGVAVGGTYWVSQRDSNEPSFGRWTFGNF